MSKQIHTRRNDDPRPLPPLVTAADVGRAGRTEVYFDEQIGMMIDEHARQRAPTRTTKRRHVVGFAGEIGVGAWRRVPINTQVYPDYEGDQGHDCLVPMRRLGREVPVEVKTTRELESPEGTVTRDELDAAEYFVLCATATPKRRVEIVGWTNERMVREYGDVYVTGRDEYLLDPEYLYPPTPTKIGPDRVRQTQYQDYRQSP